MVARFGRYRYQVNATAQRRNPELLGQSVRDASTRPSHASPATEES
jgi:hypothetical protein